MATVRAGGRTRAAARRCVSSIMQACMQVRMQVHASVYSCMQVHAGACTLACLLELRDVGDYGSLIEPQVGDTWRHGSRGEVPAIYIPHVAVDLLARGHEILNIEQPRHTKPGLGHGEGELEVLTEIDGSIRRWYDVVHHVGRVVVDERSESQPIEERLPPSRDRDAVLGDASARPLKQLGLVRAKLLDLELEDEAPGEAEDERAVAVDEIFASNVDQTDATLLDLPEARVLASWGGDRILAMQHTPYTMLTARRAGPARGQRAAFQSCVPPTSFRKLFMFSS